MSPFDKVRYARLLEGLEVREVSISEALTNKDFRIDSDFWTKVPKHNPKLAYAPIGSILETSQYGISIEMNENEKGYPIYRMNEIHNMLCDFDVRKCADIAIDEFKVFSLQDGDVLFNRTNSYEWVGRTGLFRSQKGKDFVFASYLVRFVPDKAKVLPEYLVAFLSSTFGVWDIRRRARHSINQTNVNPEEVKEIPIPLLSDRLQRAIKSCFDRATGDLLDATQSVEQAETVLLHALDLQSWKASEPLSYVRNSNEAFAAGRLDAEFFTPSVRNMLARLGRDGLTIQDVAPARKERFIPATSGDFHYIEIGGIGADGTAQAECLPQREAPSRATQFVRAGDVVTSTVRPVRRLSAVIDADQDGYVCSSGFVVLQPRAIRSDVLLTYLRLPPVCALMDLHTSASMYPAISEVDLLALPIPNVSAATQQAIEKSALAARQAKQRATQLLDAAKRAVEIAIEQDERSALAYLEAQT